MLQARPNGPVVPSGHNGVEWKSGKQARRRWITSLQEEPGSSRRASIARMDGRAGLGSGAVTDERVLAGRAALERHAFAEARELLSAADAQGVLCAADLDRLGEAAMWAGHVAECLAAFERAYAAHLERDERVAAAATALRIVRESSARGDHALTLGWYRRAARLLEGEPQAAAHGHLAQARWFSAMDKQRWTRRSGRRNR